MPSLVASPLPFPHVAPSKPPFLEDLYANYFTPTTPSLPTAYIWPEHDRPSSTPDDIEPSQATDIPVINMADDDHTLKSGLANACEQWGVFYIMNHGVPLDLLESVRQKGLELFSLPLNTKMRALRKEGSFEGFGKAMISKFFDRLMWSEGFTMMGHPTSSIADTTSKLSLGSENKFREVFEEYDRATQKVAARLMRAVLEGLGVEMEGFKERQYDVEGEAQSALQLNYYAPCPQAHMTMGLPAHTDSTCLTLLHQGLVPGLEVLRPGRPWMLVPPLSPSALVVNVGDMLQVLSNGRYKSIMHRAIANKRRERLSIVSLCFPPMNATIAPAEEVLNCSQDRQPLYKSFKWGEYMHAKSKYFMGALDHFKYQQPLDGISLAQVS
ncbi:hypothetical protein GOP47_0008916 [Adiantum capillus-veneris]|uniref:Fe2OG dioxygenase domain-containing protein n=1 Tax=Adiantum capillus-veneris TaxID=13818 RepID=A0A9D4UY51_ADICA|nr:hypothetical protein GOP47_0008218 [Adiantum capillus-veneris]KAI5076851.1 hypothetical protein GOP47_0008916 [Adiantum capillus-veneris]